MPGTRCCKIPVRSIRFWGGSRLVVTVFVGRQSFVFASTRYFWKIVSGQRSLFVLVGHSKGGKAVKKTLKVLRLSLVRPFQWPAPGQVVESDRGGAVGEHLGVLLYLLDPDEAGPGLGPV